MATEIGRAKFVLLTEKGQFSAGLQSAQGEAQSASKSISKQLAGVGSSMRQVGWNMTKFITLPIIGGLGASVAASIKWESQWVSVTKTVEGTSAELSKLEGDLRELARTTSGTHAEIATLAMVAGQMGVQVGAIKDFTKTMVMLSETTNIVGEEGSLQMARFMSIMGTAPDRVGDLGNVLVALGNNFAASEAEILQFASTLQSAGRIVGMTEDQVLAMSAALAAAGLEASSSGTAIQRVLFDMEGAVIDGGDRLEQFAKVSRMSADEFIATWETDPNKAIFSFVQGLKAIEDGGGSTIAVLKEMNLDNVRIAKTLLGLTVTVDQWGNAIGLASDEMVDGSAMLDEYEKKMNTTSAQLGLLRDRVYDAAITIGDALAPTVKMIVKGLGFFIKGLEIVAFVFSKMPTPIRLVIIGLLLMVAAIGPLLMIVGMMLMLLPGIVALSTAWATLNITVLVPSILAVAGSVLFVIAAIVAIGLVVALLTFGLIKLIDNWGAVQDVIVDFARSVPRALGKAWSAVWDFVNKVGKAGWDAMIAFGEGLQKGAKAVLNMMRDFIHALSGFFNPFKGFSLSLYDAASRAGSVSGEAFTDKLKGATQEVGHQLAEAAAPDIGALKETFGDAGQIAGEALAEGVGRGLRDVRDQIDALHGEMSRLGSLPTVEGVEQQLKIAELELSALKLAPAIEAAKKAREQQLSEIDAQLDALRSEKDKIEEEYGEFAFLFTKDIDEQIDSLEAQQKAVEDQESPAEKKNRLIEEEIDVLERLGRQRNLEMEILELRGQQADATLATDREVMVAMEDMIGTIGSVTSAIAAQTDLLWTRWIPALEAGGGAAGGAAGDLEGFGDVLEGIGDFGDIDLAAGLEEALDEAKAKVMSWFDQNKFAVVGGAVGAVAGLAFAIFGGLVGGPIGAAAGFMIGAGLGVVIGHLMDKYGGKVVGWFTSAKWMGKVKDAILAPFLWVKGSLAKHWPEIAAIISGPFRPIVELATDAFGVRTALISAIKSVEKVYDKVVGSIVNFLKDSWGVAKATAITVWNSIFSFFRTVLTSIKNFFVGTWNAIKNAIVTAITTAISFITDLLTGFVSMALSLGTQIGTSIWNGIKSFFGFLGEIGSNVVSALQKIPGMIGGVAKAIGTAIWDGIKSGLGNLGKWIIDKIANMIPGGGIISGAFSFGKKVLGVDELAGGDMNVAQDMMAFLHKGEMVVPASVAAQLRAALVSGRSGGGLRRPITGGLEALAGNQAAAMASMAGSAGGEGGRTYNITVNNPKPEAAEDSISRKLLALEHLGAGR